MIVDYGGNNDAFRSGSMLGGELVLAGSGLSNRTVTKCFTPALAPGSCDLTDMRFDDTSTFYMVGAGAVLPNGKLLTAGSARTGGNDSLGLMVTDAAGLDPRSAATGG